MVGFFWLQKMDGFSVGFHFEANDYTWDAGRTLQIQTELVKVNLLIS